MYFDELNAIFFRQDENGVWHRNEEASGVLYAIGVSALAVILTLLLGALFLIPDVIRNWGNLQ